MPHINLQHLAQIEASFSSDETMTAISWQSASRTHIGHVRHINEDAFLDSLEQKLWAVADGMGGLSRGDYASKAVVKALRNFSRQQTLSSNIEDLEARLLAANDTCRTAFRGKRLGTTVAALFAFGHYCFYLWAGDSRIYRLRDDSLEQMTEDHSVAQEKYANRELRPEQVANHPSAHILTRAAGVHQTLRLDLRYTSIQHGDRYLLCSDGLSKGLEFADIESLLGHGTPENALDCLVDLALAQGGKDNITAIVVEAGIKTSIEASTSEADLTKMTRPLKK